MFARARHGDYGGSWKPSQFQRRKRSQKEHCRFRVLQGHLHEDGHLGRNSGRDLQHCRSCRALDERQCSWGIHCLLPHVQVKAVHTCATYVWQLGPSSNRQPETNLYRQACRQIELSQYSFLRACSLQVVQLEAPEATSARLDRPRGLSIYQSGMLSALLALLAVHLNEAWHELMVMVQVGFLYLRYVANPKTLWDEWLSGYMRDSEVSTCNKCWCRHLPSCTGGLPGIWPPSGPLGISWQNADCSGSEAHVHHSVQHRLVCKTNIFLGNSSLQNLCSCAPLQCHIHV